MTTMFIANATHQIQDFCYTVPEHHGIISQPIGIGQQIRISAHGGNLSPADVECILDHHRKFGLISVEEIPRTKNFAGLCYSLDKPVSFPRLTELIQQNRGALVRRGEEQRRAAAIAVNDTIQRQVTESGSRDVLQQVVVEIEERTPAQVHGSRRGNETLARDLAEVTPFRDINDRPSVGEGFRITRDAPPPKGGRQRRA